MTQLTVYTGLFGKYDNLLEPVEPQDGVRFVCFTDDPELKSKYWKIIYVEPSGRHPRLDARRHKMLGYLDLETDISLYIDARFQFVRIREVPEYENILIHTHPNRRSAYEEASFCMKHHVGDPNGLRRMVELMRKDGMPPHTGLWYSGVVWRKKTPAVEDLCRRWWKCVSEISVRDQVSLPYVLWNTKIDHTSVKLPCSIDHFNSFVELIARPHAKQDYH